MGRNAASRRQAMTELPKLSERIVRLHTLRWNELVKLRGFTGDHLEWHISQDRRHRAATPRVSLVPPPPINVSDRHRSRIEYHGDHGEPISYDAWLKKQMAAWAARENDPHIIDSIGVLETVALAKERFAGMVGDYLAVWAVTNGNSDDFTWWLEAIEQLVGCEVGDLWRQGEWHTAWFERACRKKVQDQLGASADEWKSRASGLEIQHLENPHLSLPSLLVAGGDLNLAGTFEQSEQTIDSAQGLASLQMTDSKAIGERPIPADGVEKSPAPRASEPAAEIGPSDNKVPSRRSPKEFVDDRKAKKGRSYEKFAAHIGIGKDTLYAITKETRWVKDDIYELVAQVCNCRPADLHPRHIPLPLHRQP
jgi:hypothetical protein